MTKENSKRLYDHYVSIGKTKAAEDMLKKYPSFAEAPKVEEEVIEEAPKKEKNKK